MKNCTRIFGWLALIGWLAPFSFAQKPPSTPPPSAPPPPPTTGRPTVPTSSTQPNDSNMDMILFLTGHVKASDGSVLPNDTSIQRVCNQNVRQQVYASFHGDFSMQMGSPVNDSFVDASGDPGTLQFQNRKTVFTGIPRNELQKCELRAYASGFRPGTMSLVDLTPSGNNVDVGAIVIQRMEKPGGATLNAAPYQAPEKARKAYEKGLSATQKNKLSEAQKSFEEAVAIYPRYTSGWYQLGSVLQKQAKNDSARAAYLRATNLDTKFPPPFVALATMEFESKNWNQVIRYTNHVIELDPWNRANLAGYVVDFDPLKSAQAYYLNAAANYMLEKFDDAEKSASKALHLDLLTKFPQAHLLMAQIYAQKQNYVGAISELETYIELVPTSRDGDEVHQRLAALRKLNSPAPLSEPPHQQ